MPLTAEARPKNKTEDPWEIVDITSLPTPKIDLAAFDLRCPECKVAMHVRGGFFRITHFAHLPQNPKPDCSIRRTETVRHLMGKAVIARRLLTFPTYSGAVVREEVWFESVRRRADLVAQFSEGSFDIHEVQLAGITIKDLEERTNDYRDAGASEVIWWFAANADKPENRAWALRECGGYGLLSFREGQVNVGEPDTEPGT
jgi:competence CoiA-like predicted nuclease